MSQIQNSDELKPCPFCGCTTARLMWQNQKTGNVLYFVYCPECQTEGPSSPKGLIAKHAWNNRYKELPNVSKLTSQTNS